MGVMATLASWREMREISAFKTWAMFIGLLSMVKLLANRENLPNQEEWQAGKRRKPPKVRGHLGGLVAGLLSRSTLGSDR